MRSHKGLSHKGLSHKTRGSAPDDVSDILMASGMYHFDMNNDLARNTDCDHPAMVTDDDTDHFKVSTKRTMSPAKSRKYAISVDPTPEPKEEEAPEPAPKPRRGAKNKCALVLILLFRVLLMFALYLVWIFLILLLGLPKLLARAMRGCCWEVAGMGMREVPSMSVCELIIEAPLVLVSWGMHAQGKHIIRRLVSLKGSHQARKKSVDAEADAEEEEARRAACQRARAREPDARAPPAPQIPGWSPAYGDDVSSSRIKIFAHLIAGPRWNTGALLAQAQRTAVEKTLSIETATANVSADQWTVVAYSSLGTAFGLNGGLGERARGEVKRECGGKPDPSWFEVELDEPDRITVSMRYYGFDAKPMFPAIKVDGELATQETPVVYSLDQFFLAILACAPPRTTHRPPPPTTHRPPPSVPPAARPSPSAARRPCARAPTPPGPRAAARRRSTTRSRGTCTRSSASSTAGQPSRGAPSCPRATRRRATSSAPCTMAAACASRCRRACGRRPTWCT